MTTPPRIAAELRALVLELGKMAPASGQAARYFRACQRIAALADQIETPQRETTPAPRVQRSMRREFTPGPIVSPRGRLVEIVFTNRRAAA